MHAKAGAAQITVALADKYGLIDILISSIPYMCPYDFVSYGTLTFSWERVSSVIVINSALERTTTDTFLLQL